MLEPIALRLHPGDDLRAALERLRVEQGGGGVFVVSGIGSLSVAQVRFAGAGTATAIPGDLEILMLCGTLGDGGSHLHMALADAQGRVVGGHVAPGCIVRTTAEVLLVRLPGWRFDRALDPATGFGELVARPPTGS